MATEHRDEAELEIVRRRLDALMDSRRTGHLTVEDQRLLNELLAKERRLLSHRG